MNEDVHFYMDYKMLVVLRSFQNKTLLFELEEREKGNE